MYRFYFIVIILIGLLTHLKAEEAPFFLTSTPDGYLTLSSQSLGEEFLLQPMGISQRPLQTFQGLASRVITFHKAGSRLFLLQSLKGSVLSEDIPSSIILAEFPIIKHLSSDDEMTFDFNEGMSHIFTTGSFAVSDFDLNFNPYDAHIINTDTSYLDEITLLDDNRIFIRQKAQLRIQNSSSDTSLLDSVEVRYLLEPYTPNLDFVPLLSTENFDYLGFFESPPQLSSNMKYYDLYALKYDIRNPIVFSLSSSIPEKYRKAVRDGVLYWNKAFGKEVVRVEEAPSTVTGPHPDYNIIHWAKSDALFFAYADMQNDPRTGEILNSQIFVGGGLDDAFRMTSLALIKDFEHDKKSHSQFPLHTTTLKGFEKKPLCSYQYNYRSLADFLKWRQTLSVTGSDNSDDKGNNTKILQMISDSLTTVVAHEVGHVLGLRHNFAGNLVKDIHRIVYENHWNNYLDSGGIPNDMVISSSVMDYNSIRDDMMLGRQIRSPETAALSHDKLAIEFLYEGKTLDEFKFHDLPLYCPGSLIVYNPVEGYQDCMMSDTFRSQAMEAKHLFQSSLESLPYLILEEFVFWLDPPSGFSKKPPLRVELFPSRVAKWLLAMPQKNFLELLTPKKRLLKVDRLFVKVDETNQEYVEERTVQSIAQDITNNGGMDEILKTLPRGFVATEMQRFSDILTKSYRKGVGFNGNPYEFSEEDIQLIQNQGRRFYTVLWEKFPALYLESFTSLVEIRNEALSNDLANFLYRKSQHYLMTTTNSFIHGSFQKEGRTIFVQIPNFLYNFKTRELAAKVLTHEWSEVEKESLGKEFHLFLQKFLEGEKISDIEERDTSENLRVWHREQTKILEQLEGEL